MFLQFIQSLKSCLTSKAMKYLVIGNESADMDSVVGSLVYSYILQKKLGDGFNVIPVCCIPKDKMYLKKDVIKWLEIFNVDAMNDIIFLEDVNDLLYSEQIDYPLQICLIDHHKPLLPVMSKYVREVIDHRKTIFFYPKDQLKVNNIELVGSCCTLIAKYITDSISKDDRKILFKLLYGVILLDTDCLTLNNGKTTDKDVNTVEMIEKFLDLPLASRLENFQLLSQAKSDISGFTVEQMVHRDLKMLNFKWNNTTINIAIPTLVSVDIEDLLATENLEIQLTEILDNLKANLFIGLTCGTSSNNRRGYLLFSKIDGLNDALARYLFMPEHKLNLQTVVRKENIDCFRQNDLRTSRKIFIPIIEKFFTVFQKNNNNMTERIIPNPLIKNDEMDIIADRNEMMENDGAPYTLSTPLRSYSGSPDNRTPEISLPSLNNWHTLQLVDRKRRKHSADMNEEDTIDEGNVLNPGNGCNDNISPLIFTPENSDDDESSSFSSAGDNNDNIGPLPSFKSFSSAEDIKGRRKKLAIEDFIDSDSKSETVANRVQLSIVNARDEKSDRVYNFSETDSNDSEFLSLVEKVNRKRKKLQSGHISSIARSLVEDVLNNSENIVLDEINVESFLDDWSECYSEEEKRRIFDCVYRNDMTQLSHLLTSCLIKDCLNVPDTNWCHVDSVTSDLIDAKLPDYVDIDSYDDLDNLENLLPTINRNYSDCHMGNIINEENQCILANNVNSSSADVVENISFNLYRRISTNQLNYSDDEKELLLSVGDWLPKEDVIYSDPECEEQNDYSDGDDATNDTLSTKISFRDTNICMNASTNSL